MKTLMLADTSSLDVGCKHKFPKHRVDYKAILEIYSEFDLSSRVAFNKYSGQTTIQFERLMRFLKFDCYFGRPQQNMEMALHLAGRIQHDKIQALIMGTRETCHIPLLEYARACGVKTHVFGFNVPKLLYEYAEVLDVDESCIQPMHSHRIGTVTECAA